MKLFKSLSIIVTLTASLTYSMQHPKDSLEKPTLEKYLKQHEFEDHVYIQYNICGVEIAVYKKGYTPMDFYALSCPKAEELLQTLSQKLDKSDYSVSHLEMRKGSNKEEKANISFEEAQSALTVFSASVQPRIKEFQESAKQKHIQDYENKFGSSEKR